MYNMYLSLTHEERRIKFETGISRFSLAPPTFSLGKGVFGTSLSRNLQRFSQPSPVLVNQSIGNLIKIFKAISLVPKRFCSFITYSLEVFLFTYIL